MDKYWDPVDQSLDSNSIKKISESSHGLYDKFLYYKKHPWAIWRNAIFLFLLSIVFLILSLEYNFFGLLIIFVILFVNVVYYASIIDISKK